MLTLNSESRCRMLDQDIIHRYIHGGRGIVTLEAPSGKSHMYAFYRPKNDSIFPEDIIFVYAVHDRCKLYYIGMLGGDCFRLTHNSRYLSDTEIVKGAKYIVNMSNVVGFAQRSKMKLFHEGVCCRCGRALKTEKSLQQGIGSKCLKLCSI